MCKAPKTCSLLAASRPSPARGNSVRHYDYDALLKNETLATATAAQASPYIRYLAPKLVRRGALSRVVHAALGPVNSTAHQC